MSIDHALIEEIADTLIGIRDALERIANHLAPPQPEEAAGEERFIVMPEGERWLEEQLGQQRLPINLDAEKPS